jgi:retron-type reverse transcriptase
MDIKGFSGNIDHELLVRAVEKHSDCKWVRLYITRWLKAPVQMLDGSLVEAEKGTPQGGVIVENDTFGSNHYKDELWNKVKKLAYIL